MHILVIFGAPWNKQSPWILSGTEVSGCKGKDILPFFASSDSQGPHDQIIEELNSHFSRWISDVASTGTPSTPGPGHAGLQFPHALPLNAASASRRGFSPLCDTKLAAFRASAGAALAVPGPRSLALSHSADRTLPSQKKLTE